jgi:hypothetical protein
MRIPSFPPALLAVAAVALCAVPAATQDLLAVDFAGTAYVLDSFTGQGTLLRAGAAPRANAMARKDGTLWLNEHTGTHDLSQIDEHTGVVTRVHSDLGVDLRGLATTGSFRQLLGITDRTPSDRLVRIDLGSGSVTTIGSTGFTTLQALTLQQAQFLAWDLTHGLVRIDHLTGAGTDVNPSVGTGGATIQFLVAMADGRLLGGSNALYEIDPATGVPTLLGSGGYADLRGAEERFGWADSFGRACLGAGGFVDMNVAGVPEPGNQIQVLSIRHAPNVPGVLCIGLSRTRAGTTPLPFDVDPLLGTVGCHVWQSCDITVFGVGTFQGRLQFPLTIPTNLRGATFHLQHAAIEPVPGGWSFSNAATVRTGL